MNKLQKSSQIELLRGFAILGVLMIHTSMHFRSSNQVDVLVLTNIVIDIVAHFAVPLFIFISGFTLFMNYPRPINMRNFYTKRCASTVPQYLLFSFLYMAPAIYKSGSLSVLEVLKKIIVFNASFHLWFFHILFSFYLLYPMIRKIYDYFAMRFQIKKLIIIAIVLQLSWAIGDIVLPRDFKIISIVLFATKFLGWIAYFILGMLACSHREILIKVINTNISRIVSTILVSVLTISIIWVDIYFGTKNVILKISNTALDLILFFAIIALLLLVSTKLDRMNSALKKSLLCIGNYSFGIYLVHIVHMVIFSKFIAPIMNINPSSWLFYLSLFFFMLSMSTVTVYVISALPFHHLVIGKVSRMILDTSQSK